MNKIFSLLIVSLITATNVFANDARAEEVLKQAREAIGGERLSFGIETQPFKLFRFTSNYQYQRGVHLLHGRNLNAPIPGFGRPDPTVGNITNIESSAYSSGHRLMINVGPARFVQGLSGV